MKGLRDEGIRYRQLQLTDSWRNWGWALAQLELMRLKPYFLTANLDPLAEANGNEYLRLLF